MRFGTARGKVQPALFLPGFAENPQNSRITHFHQFGCFHTCIRFFLVHLILSALLWKPNQTKTTPLPNVSITGTSLRRNPTSFIDSQQRLRKAKQPTSLLSWHSLLSFPGTVNTFYYPVRTGLYTTICLAP